jgi:hypothetical protein
MDKKTTFQTQMLVIEKDDGGRGLKGPDGDVFGKVIDVMLRISGYRVGDVIDVNLELEGSRGYDTLPF